MYDMLIRGGTVVDGTGSKPFRADVAVCGGKIAAVAETITPERAEKLVDAAGMIVAPGFIDMHAHSDLTVLKGRSGANVLEQGITMEVTGHCGESVTPPIKEMKRAVDSDDISKIERIEANGGTLRALLQELKECPPPTNMAFFIGHGNLRAKVMGYADRRPTEEELERMRALLRAEMEAGALGMSTGLIYPPGSYADTNELVELAKVAAAYGGIYSSHIRSEGDRLVESVEEAIKIGRRAGLRFWCHTTRCPAEGTAARACRHLHSSHRRTR